MELGISEKLSFSRDRVVESFLYAGGVAYEHEHGSLRKWLSKVIKLVLIIDDLYDIYGCLEDLECFTTVVDRLAQNLHLKLHSSFLLTIPLDFIYKI